MHTTVRVRKVLLQKVPVVVWTFHVISVFAGIPRNAYKFHEILDFSRCLRHIHDKMTIDCIDDKSTAVSTYTHNNITNGLNDDTIT